MLTVTLKAMAAGLTLVDVLALVVAYPLATQFQAWLGRSAQAPTTEALAAALVLGVVFLATTAWVHLLVAARVEGAAVLEIVRPVRVFATIAVMLVAAASFTEQRAHYRLLIGLHAAFALALVVGVRLGWRAVAAASLRGDRSPIAGDPPAAEPGDRELDFALAPDEGGDRSAPLARGRTSGFGVEGLRSRMDEVSYTPGRPNVLSMTRYVHPGEGERTRALEGTGGCAGDAAVAVERLDDGAETVLRIAGVLDALTVADARPAVEALVLDRRTSITLDLSSLRLIDSSGVALVVGLFKRCRTFDGVVRVSGLRDQPLAIFRLLRLERIFNLS